MLSETILCDQSAFKYDYKNTFVIMDLFHCMNLCLKCYCDNKHLPIGMSAAVAWSNSFSQLNFSWKFNTLPPHPRGGSFPCVIGSINLKNEIRQLTMKLHDK